MSALTTPAARLRSIRPGAIAAHVAGIRERASARPSSARTVDRAAIALLSELDGIDARLDSIDARLDEMGADMREHGAVLDRISAALLGRADR